MNAAQAFIAYLRCEAKQAEERAKSLRATADAIQLNAQSNIANRNKKRKRNPAASTPETWKRAHTGYTLFVQENLLSIKENTAASQDEVINEKEIISTLARRWSQIDDLEKQSWQERADQLNVARVTEKRQTSVDLEHSVGTDIIEALDLREHDLMEADDESNARKAACK